MLIIPGICLFPDCMIFIARVSKLGVSRDIQLCNIMYSLTCNGFYTRSTRIYVFQTDIVHTDIYDKSPYYNSVTLWNSLPKKIKF